MAKIYGQLENAQLENKSSDYSTGVVGRVWFNTGTGVIKYDDGSNVKTITPSGAIANVDIVSGAAIARNKLAVGTAAHVLINDGSGVMSSELTLAKVRGGAAADMTNVTFPSTGTLLTTEVAQTSAFVGGAVANIGLSLSGGTLTICAADGTALSSTNPGIVQIRSAVTAGKVVKIKLTANKTIKDAASGASELSGVLWGTTTGIAWSTARLPLFLFAANLDDTDAGLAFCLSRSPLQQFGIGGGDPGYLGYKGTAPVNGSAYDSVFLLGSSPSSYAGKPALLIGGLQATKSAGNDWTLILPLASHNQGITPTPHQGVYYNLPLNLYTGSTNFFVQGGAGTPPSWNNQAVTLYQYKIGLDGMIDAEYSTGFSGTTNCTNGTTSTSLFFILPQEPNEANTTVYVPIATGRINGTGQIILGKFSSPSARIIQLYKTDFTAIASTAFASSSDELHFKFRYQGFVAIPN